MLVPAALMQFAMHALWHLTGVFSQLDKTAAVAAGPTSTESQVLLSISK